MSTTYVGKSELVDRYPEWKDKVENGDFKVYMEDGSTVIEWSNTNIFLPSVGDMIYTIAREFPLGQRELVKCYAGILSLRLMIPKQRP
jgi:hypothetical protein